jgi:hypothetical protein
MKHAPCVILLLGLTLATAGAQSSELRTFTNTQGKAIQAKLVGTAGDQVTIEMAGGQRFTLGIGTLSAADQAYIKQAAASSPAPGTVNPSPPVAGGFKPKPGPNDKLDPAVVNEVVGLPLFAEAMLWQTKADEVAGKLELKKESETKTSSSFRSYPKDTFRMFGARPYSVALYAADGLTTNLSLVFANKGDLFGMDGENNNRVDRNTPKAQALAILEKAMKADVAAISAKLSEKLGEPVKQMFGDGESRQKMLRWDWRGHSVLLREQEGEYVGVELVTTEVADAGGKVKMTGDKIIRDRALANVEKRTNGDVVINEIPMVDQGPKGYCVPATAERAMRYLSVPADMYVLAMAGETNIGGGTSVQMLLDGVRMDIRRKGRSFDSWQSEFKLKDLQKYIDKGVPVIWGLYSTDAFNDLANKRTKDRQGMTDVTAWKAKLAETNGTATLRKEKDQGHVVLIIGYNKETNEIAFSDSWGERYKERWITIPEAEMISQQEYWVVGF